MGVGGAPGERGGLLADDPRELARRVPEICAGPRGRPNRQAREMSRPDSPEGWLAPGIVGTGRGRLGRFVGRVRVRTSQAIRPAARSMRNARTRVTVTSVIRCKSATP